MPTKDPEARKRHWREHYERNKDAYTEKSRLEKLRKRAYLDEAKDQPCMDCNQSFPSCVMDFDHRDGKDKSFNLGTAGVTMGWAKLRAEVAKCDVICANCHRIRTFITRPLERGGNGRHTCL